MHNTKVPNLPDLVPGQNKYKFDRNFAKTGAKAICLAVANEVCLAVANEVCLAVAKKVFNSIEQKSLKKFFENKVQK